MIQVTLIFRGGKNSSHEKQKQIRGCIPSHYVRCKWLILSLLYKAFRCNFLTENHEASSLVRRREGISLVDSSKSTRTGDENDKENPKLRGPRAATNVASTDFRMRSFPAGILVIWIDTESLTSSDVFILEVSVILATEHQSVILFIGNAMHCFPHAHTHTKKLSTYTWMKKNVMFSVTTEANTYGKRFW